MEPANTHRYQYCDHFGSAFFWENRRYLESGDSLYKAMGNVPFVVDRRTGQVTHVGPGSTDVVADYEAMVVKG